MEVTKTCSICAKEKSLSEFYKTKTGIDYRCKVCNSQRLKQYRDNNPEKVKAMKAEWYSSEKERVKESKKMERQVNPKLNMLATAKHRAKIKAVPFNLTEADIHIPEFCPVLGFKLEVAKGKATDKSPSLDRIIPELGYVVGNVQVISRLANSMKTNANPTELINFAKWVLATFKEKDDSR